VDGIKLHFKLIGKPFPDGMSVSEAALNLTNRDFAADPTEVDKVLDAWAAEEQLPLIAVNTMSTPPRMANSLEQLVTLTKRGVVNSSRDKTNWLGPVLTHIFMQLMIAAFIPGGDFSQATIQMKNGGVIVLLMIFSMLPAINMPFYEGEMRLLGLEMREGKVNPFVYILVSSVVQLPIICITSILSSKPPRIPRLEPRARVTQGAYIGVACSTTTRVQHHHRAPIDYPPWQWPSSTGWGQARMRRMGRASAS
jgi:hypothetical protein